MQDTCHIWTQLNDLTLHEFSSSVDRAPARCSGGHGFDSCRDSDFFFVPRSCHVDQFTFHISLPSLKFTIFIHLSRIPTLSFRKITRCVCSNWKPRYKRNHRNIPRRLKRCINSRKRWDKRLLFNIVNPLLNRLASDKNMCPLKRGVRL